MIVLIYMLPLEIILGILWHNLYCILEGTQNEREENFWLINL